MPKTLAEIAIDAALINKADAAKAGRLADARGQPLVVVLIRELGIDEVALLGAFRKQTRVPLVDPASIEIQSDALALVPRAVCARRCAFPLSVHTDSQGRVLRMAMADPTDTAAVAELEQLAGCEVEVAALSLSAIEELITKGYQDTPGGRSGGTIFITSKGKIATAEMDSEVSVTAQIPFSALQQAVGTDELQARLAALVQVLTAKGLITEAELAEALSKRIGPTDG
ncbi:MAG: hypothetical protein AB7O24_04115 [Kofleriaceae bacterium]